MSEPTATDMQVVLDAMTDADVLDQMVLTGMQGTLNGLSHKEGKLMQPLITRIEQIRTRLKELDHAAG